MPFYRIHGIARILLRDYILLFAAESSKMPVVIDELMRKKEAGYSTEHIFWKR
jgi:hypothetical protein